MSIALDIQLSPDLEKASSGACGYFDRNSVIFRTFWVKYTILLAKDGGKRVEDGELRLVKGDSR